MKKTETLKSLFFDLPHELLEFLDYIKKLAFKETPDYSKLELLLKSLAIKNHISLADDDWDWTRGRRGSPLKREEGGKKCESPLEKSEKINKKSKKNEESPEIQAIVRKRTEIERKRRDSIPEIREIKEERKQSYVKYHSKALKKRGSFLMVGRETGEEEIASSFSDNVYFNSKSLISSNNDTKESSVMIMNRDFTTLKKNCQLEIEENGIKKTDNKMVK